MRAALPCASLRPCPPGAPRSRARSTSGRRFPLLPATLLLTAAAVAIAAAPAWSQVKSMRVASGLNRPIFVTAPPGDHRLFIVEQRGVVKILVNGAVLATPFLDIDAIVPEIGSFDERGLLGLAFDPDFASNRRIYVNYTDLSGDTHIRRYVVSAGDPNVVDLSTAEDLLVIDQPQSNHNGGTLAFSPVDGYLYVGMGDGGGSGDPNERAQDPAELLGKMLRLDVSGESGYSIPPGNPYQNLEGWRDEIWALGLRNPYRWSFDRATGDLWIGDVGQFDWEEIDVQPASSSGGENYGWDIMEGTHCYEPPSGCDPTGLVLPIHEYGHNGNCSITGGSVYRGSVIPGLAGTYFFADFCSARVWSLRYSDGSVSEFTERTAELAPGGGLLIEDIAAIGEDGFGELYIVDRDNNSTTGGEIYRILPAESASVDEGGLTAEGPLVFRRIAPNPFRDHVRFDLQTDAPGRLRVDVIDPLGKVVRRLEADAPGGPASLAWDGRDDDGRALPAGVYFARVEHNGRRLTRTVSFIR